jgi:hypothetical protein
MAKAFSVVSWNVEHLGASSKSTAERPARSVSDRLAPLFAVNPAPDVVALYEVEGAEVWREVMAGFPGYSFFITEGENTQEILVGIGPAVTGFMTQKLEFREHNPFLRPGSLLTVQPKGSDDEYAMLFLHLKSLRDAGGFGTRTDMIDRAFAFKKTLDKAVGGAANYMFLGDLNTMGMDYTFNRLANRRLEHLQVSEEQEISRLTYLAADSGMRVLSKDAPASWGDPKSASMRSNLDHVVATGGLRFKSFGGSDIELLGWPKEPDVTAQAKWMLDHSDHGLLRFQVEK